MEISINVDIIMISNKNIATNLEMMFHKNTSGADVLCGSYLGESGSSKVSHSETVTAVTNTNFRYLKNGSLPFPASHFEGSKAPTSNSSRSRTPSIGRPAKKMRSFTYQNPRKNLAFCGFLWSSRAFLQFNWDSFVSHIKM